MKKILALLTASVMALAMAGCGSDSSSSTADTTAAGTTAAADSSKTDKKIVIGYATKSSSSPFWVENIKGAQQAADELGVELKVIGPPVENDVYGQIAVLEDMVQSKVDAIVVAPCGDVGVADIVKKAMGAKIPVVAVDNGVEGVDVDSLVSTDNYAAGAMAAEFIGTKIGGEGTVIIVNGIVAQGSGKGRRDGFVEFMQKTYGDKVKVVEVAGEWDDQKALSGFEAALAANKDVKGTYAAWDGGALAIHKVLQTEGLKNVAICGFDCYDAALQLMKDKDSNFVADIAQNPSNMGYTAVKTAYAALNGETIEKNIDTGTTLVTHDNVQEYADKMGVTLK